MYENMMMMIMMMEVSSYYLDHTTHLVLRVLDAFSMHLTAYFEYSFSFDVPAVKIQGELEPSPRLSERELDRGWPMDQSWVLRAVSRGFEP